MTRRMAMLSLAVAILVTLGWTNVDRADEQQPQSTARNVAQASADNPLADVATGQPTAARVKETLTKGQPITITFKYGDEDPNLICNVIDDRPITAATTVGSVLSKAASATTIFRPADAIISVVRSHAVIGDDLNVNVAEESLRVEWDLASNRPTENTNYKLQPGDRIVVWQPAPAAGQGFIRLAPKAPPAGVWTPTIPPPSEPDPFRPTSVSYVARPVSAAVPVAPPTSLADNLFAEVAAQQRPADANADAAAGFRFPSVALPNSSWPASTAAGLPFFGHVSVTPDPVKFREFVEEIVLPNGQMQAVKRRLPARPWMTFTIRFIVDSSSSLELFSPIQKTGQMVADSESLTGTLRILEANKLISPIDGKSTIGQELSPLISGGSHSERTILDEATGQPRPGEVTDWFIDIMPTDLRGQLHVAIKLQYTLNGRTWEATPTAEIGRGQSLLARLKPVPDQVPADVKREDKPRYVLLTPELAPTPEPGPIPIAAPPDPMPAINASNQAGVGQYAVAPAAAAMPVREADEVRKPHVRITASVVEDISGSLAEFMPLPDQPPFEMVDSATLGAAVRILEKQGLVRRFSKAGLAAISGEPATMNIQNAKGATPDAPFDDFHAEVTAESLRGGMSVEFKVQQTAAGRKNETSFAMLVVDGQSIIARTDSVKIKKGSGTGKREENGDKKLGSHPVYIILTPELVR